MNESSTGKQGAWDGTPSRNLLLPENLDLVRHELLNDGVVFGWHYYYAGGRSGDMFCFSDYESYYHRLSDSRPGDHFTVYSRNRLATKALCRLGDPTSNRPILDAHDLVEVKNAMAAGKEIVFLWCHAQPETGRIDCDAGTLWDLTEEELEESLRLRSGRSGEFLFFPVQMLDDDEDGNPISSVSSGAKTRVNAVVDGKRPNEAGLTPASGLY
jgi:hypothetical protein